MKKNVLMLLCILLLAGCVSRVKTVPPELVLIEKGKSQAVIVLPDKVATPVLDKLLNQFARDLAEILAEGTGAKLPIIRESKLAPGKPAIMLGRTRFALQNGVRFDDLKYWDAVIKVKGNRLILAGVDKPESLDAGKRGWRHVLSSVRAMTEFLQKYARVRFLIPGKNGIHVPPLSRLALPGDTDLLLRPRFRYARRRPIDLLHMIANGFFNSNDTKLYGGHSYYTAVPTPKYGKSNPEYFHLVGNSRSSFGNHLCISNPQVQQLMLDEMVKQVDKGYEFVELAQTDAYVPCSCTGCKKLYNTDDEGEKLWLFHRDLAERFKKLRPGKKVMIISYGPTGYPPKTFKKFPSNVCIEICAYSKENLDRWKEYEVPHGFTVYLYNWGLYHVSGLSPKRTVAYLENQLKLFDNYNINALFFCGIGELYGLEGPAYYAYARMMNDPSVKGADAFREYCQAAFGEASLPMEKFYSTIDQALTAYPGNMRGEQRTIYRPRGVLPGVFMTDVLAILSSQLKAAESLARHPKVKARLRLVRTEFDFFNSTVRSVNFYNTYRLAPNWATFGLLEKEVTHRNKLIDKLFYKKNNKGTRRLKGWENLVFFGHNATRKLVKANGSSSAAMGAPFDWDFKLLRRNKILPFAFMPRATVEKAAKDAFNFNFESGCWAKSKWNTMTGIQLAAPTVPTRFKLLYDNKYLYVAFDGKVNNSRSYTAMKKDGKCWGQDSFEIMLDPFGDRSRHYHMMFNFLPNSFYDARRGFVSDMLDPNFHRADPNWDGKWDYKTRRQGGRIQGVARIAFDSLKAPVPVKGTIWTGNFGREEYHDGVKHPELILWAPNPEALNFHDRDKFGEISFK